MSVARARIFGLSRRLIRIPPSAQSRRASSHSHPEDTNVYPRETFNTPFWRNTLLLSLLGIGIYKIVPLLDEDGDYITRYIGHYATPPQTWTRVNDKHLGLALHAAQGQLLIGAAQRPTVHRMRQPASFNMGSPHCVAVGSEVDISNIAVKKDKLWTE